MSNVENCEGVSDDRFGILYRDGEYKTSRQSGFNFEMFALVQKFLNSNNRSSAKVTIYGW
jgi:hypothetical protein